MGIVKKAPQVVVHHLGDCDGPPFLTLRHLRCKLEYPSGEMSEEFVHDVVERKSADAVVICAYDISDPRDPKVWLRSCVRIAMCTKTPFPNSDGSGWELPAGLIDGDEHPISTAFRELQEEVWICVPKKQQPGKIFKIGPTISGSVGLSGEVLYFYAIDVTGLPVGKPSEDGSPQERNGECVLVSIDDALHAGDMKTELGVMRLKNFLTEFELVE